VPVEQDKRDLFAASLVLAAIVLLAIGAFILLASIDASKSKDVADVASGAIAAVSAIGGLLVGHRLGTRTARDYKRRAHEFERHLDQDKLEQALNALAHRDPDLA
jgi:hypothetical protein